MATFIYTDNPMTTSTKKNKTPKPALTPPSDDQGLSWLNGVGKQTASHLNRLNVRTTIDLLFHLPSRYQDRTQIECIRRLKPGDHAVIEGTVRNITQLPRGKTKLICELRDETGVMWLRFFHILSFQLNAFKPGTRLRCYSEVRQGQHGLEMIHPELQIVTEGKPLPVAEHLTPIYPTTDGLSQFTLRKLTTHVLNWLQRENDFNELLPDAILQTLPYPSVKDALQFIHRPPQKTTITDLINAKTNAQQRLIFEELLAHRLSLLHFKKNFQTQAAQPLPATQALSSAFLKQLPFALTNAQSKVYDDIKQDLSRAHPMLRLVQGDVGSGKTVVAALAMLQAVENKTQAALMVPTELLAEQHYRNFHRWLTALGLQVVFLVSHIKGAARKKIITDIETGTAQIVIGTHALFQEDIKFANLALVVIDEQHRFGVHQRAQLREKGQQGATYPHQLIMTATPIPRTLAMSFYADLDCSIIDELPPGRTPVITSVIAGAKRTEIIDRIRHTCLQGRQAYWVCSLIDESETLNCQSATQTAETLQALMPELKVGLIHGRMRQPEKEATMQAFQANQIQLLVATTVIEVGVDVPNACVMVIENAERLGLAQLHQLRGRVGRGSAASYCILLYEYPLSNIARERLAAMRETTDGFRIAERDLALRGPGEVLGTRQTGELLFRIADLTRDSHLLTTIHRVADVLLADHPLIVPLLINRWLNRPEVYAKV